MDLNIIEEEKRKIKLYKHYNHSNQLVKDINVEIELDEVITGIIKLIPPVWQFPKITCGRIFVKGKEYKSENFQETKWKQSSNIIVNDETIGFIEVCYLKETKEFDEGPFLKGERELIDDLATNLGTFIKRKITKLSIEENQEGLNALIENAPLAIFLIYQDGKILRVNEEALNLIKYDEGEILNFNIFDLFKGNDREMIKCHYLKDIYNLASGNTIEAKVMTKSGVFIDVEIISTILKISENIIIQSFFSDITERKNSEIHRELLLDQLISSLEFKSKFLATMSHELRTPLNAILGFSQLILEESYGKINADQKEFMDDINSAGNHLLTLINSILDISKIEAGKLKLNFKELQLKPFLEEVQSIIKPLYKGKEITFSIEGIKQDDILTIDPMRFKQILYNLLSNAIKYTEKGSVKIKAIPRSDHWEFQVIDTGIGIDKEDYNIIFQEFGRIEDDKVRDISGTGLGLALTKQLIRKCGGDIWFESEFGKGTTFFFTIPKIKLERKK